MHISALWAEQRYPPGGKNEGEGRTAAPRFFSAALCPAGAPVAPVQYFFNLAPPVQDLPAEDIVWKRAVAPVLAQCPATDLQQACHFPVTQIFILFWQNPPRLWKGRRLPPTAGRCAHERTSSTHHPLSSIHYT